MNWEIFYDDPLYSKILTYWYDEWELISEEVKNGTIGIDIVNIRIVLQDIINEYELNQFESENNRKVYIKLIDTFISKKHISFLQEELLILKEKLEKKEKKAVYIISKELSNLISRESFVHALFDEIFLILDKKLFQKKHRLKIQELTKEVIVDLVTSGVDVKDIKKLIFETFASYYILDKGKIHINYEGVPEELETDKEKKDYIDQLSIQDRLNFFRKKLLFDEDDYIFVYPIWGGVLPFLDESDDFSIMGCQLYNPTVEKMFSENSFFDETFDTNRFEKQTGEASDGDGNQFPSRCNAKILITAASANSAKEAANLKLSRLLNMLNFSLNRRNHEFFWDGQYIGRKVDDEEKSIGSLFDVKEDKYIRRNTSKKHPKFLNEEKYKDVKRVSQIIEELERRGEFYEANTILSVINIMEQAQWQNQENKLLNYWIALESLANISKNDKKSKFEFIKETISNMYFLNEQYSPLYNLFKVTDIYSRNSYETDETVNIPNEFLRNTGIRGSRSKGSVVSLDNFYNRINELREYTTKESFLDQIEDTIAFYENKDKAKVLKQLREKRSEVELTIDYIYKCRNQVVHNGYVDKNLIPYLVNFSEAYAISLINRIIYVYTEGQYNLQNHFLKESYEGALLEKKLSKGHPLKLVFV